MTSIIYWQHRNETGKNNKPNHKLRWVHNSIMLQILQAHNTPYMLATELHQGTVVAKSYRNGTQAFVAVLTWTMSE